MSYHIMGFLITGLLLGSSSPSAAPKSTSKTPLFHQSRHVTPAHKGLQQITQTLNQAPVVRATFTQQKKLASLRFPLRSHGTFLLVRNRGVSWKMLAPFPSHITITAKGLTQTAGAQTTRITKQTKPALFGITSMFLAMFSGQPKTLHKHFHIYLKRHATQWQIGLKPKQALLKRIFSSMVLTGNTTITHVKMNERSGDTTDIAFSNIRITPTTLTKKEQAQLAK